MTYLYAFWAVDALGRPTDPDALDPWGDASPLDALDLHDRDALGPYLTVVDAATGALRYAGDATDRLGAFAASVAQRLDLPLDAGADPLDRAVAAAHALTSDVAKHAAREALGHWRDPTPDRHRAGPLPDAVRRDLRLGAEAAGREATARLLRRHLDGTPWPARRAA